MANPQQPSSIFDVAEEDAAGPVNPASSTTTGGTGSIFDLTTEGETTSGPAFQRTPAQKSESNTLWGDAKAETVVGEIGAGIQTGVRGVLAAPPAIAGLATSYFDEGLGTAFMEWSKQIAEGGAKRGVAQLEDLTANPISWARYVAGTTGEAVPFILSIMGGAGAGSLLSGLLRKKGVDAATKSAIMSSAPAFGGAFATASAIETGATARELFDVDKEIRPGASLLAGTAKGALESVFPLVLARQYGLGIAQGTDLYGRLLGVLGNQGGTRLGQIGAGIATEGMTELMQEEVDIQTRAFFDEKYGQMSPDAWSRRANSFVAGGVGGGVFSSFTPIEAQTALADKDIRDAVGETPIVFGATEAEIPIAGPDQILRNSAGGLDATAGLAVGAMLDQSLNTVDLRSRGLFGAVIDGRDVTFGSQDQANNDHDYYQGTGFLRLDPSMVTRGDVTSAAEDLPDTLNDPRVDFLDKDNMSKASSLLTEAIVLKSKAASAAKVQTRETLLAASHAKYREAVNLGARVEPLLDGQMILRDPAKATALAQAQRNVDPQVSRASLLETRVRGAGKNSFYVMAAGSPKARKRPGGKALDLENIHPDDITAFPTRDLARQVLSNQQIARKLDVSSANARGIRFLPSVTNPQAALQELVNILQSMSQGVRFYKQKAAMVERFMDLVDQGVRIDVRPDNEEFAVLRQVRESELVDKLRDEAGPEITTDAGTKRIIKQRAKRERDPRVAKLVGFSDPGVQALFYSQFHNTSLLKMLTGKLEDIAKGVDTASLTGYKQVAGSSPLLNFLREFAKSMGIKTDFFIEVVTPGSLGETGVKYIEDSRVLKEGGKPQSRSVIQIDPWYYSQPTAGGKKLIRANQTRTARNFLARPLGAQKRGDTFSVVPANAAGLKSVRVAPEAFDATYPNVKHFLRKYNFETGKWDFVKAGVHEELVAELERKYGEALAEATAVDDKVAQDWTKGVENAVKPQPKPPELSTAGKLAKKMGVADTKLFTDDAQVMNFYTDFTKSLGEVIVRYEWDGLSHGTKELIQTAYQREVNASRSLTRAQALSRTFAHPILERAIGERGKKGELYNFEEWLFQNISRVLVNPESNIGPLKKFFNDVARNLMFMMKRVAKLVGAPYDFDRNKGAAAEEVQKWIEKLATRGTSKNMDEPFLSESTRKSALASLAANQKALDGWNMEYVVATPQKASTAQVRKLLDHIPEDALEDRTKLEGLLAVADRHNTMLEWLLGIHQLADLNGHIEPLQRYVSTTRAMEDDAMAWATMADERLRAAQKLPKVQQRAVWALMNDLDQMVYLDQKKLKAGTQKPRWPTADELTVLVRQHKLSAEAFQVYTAMRTDYLSFLTQLEITGLRNAEETITDPAKMDEKQKEISGQIAQMRGRPYFPHMRFGKYIVTVKNSGGEIKFFQAFETIAAREAALPAIQKAWQIPQINSIVSDEMSPAMQQYQGLPKFALDEVKKALGLDAEQLNEQQRKDRDALEALTFDAAPINSFRHNLSERKNTPGYSMDGLRAYATYFARSARFVARMEYSHRLQESIKDVRRSASPISKDSRTRIADYMQRHYDAEMNPSVDWATARALGFMWYFAFAPAAAFVNLSQVPMVTYPYLASKFPGVKRGLGGNAIQVLNKNIKELTGWVKGEFRVTDGPKQEALDQAHTERLIDDGFAQELAAISQGSVLSRTLADGKVARSVRHMSQWGTYPFAAAERFNRSVTFRTAWDLATANPDNVYVKEALGKNKIEADRLRIDRGWTDQHISAYIFAAEAVRASQFEYSRWARPKIMQGKGSVFFMFKTYLQNMLFFMFNANRGTQVRMMLLLFATAGLMGLPGAEDAEELAKALAKLMGFHIDPRLWIRRMMKDWTGDAGLADILLHGASRVGFGIPAAMNGLGVPAATPDLSASLSMGRLVPGLAAGLDNDASNFNELLGDITSEIAGPLLGVPFAMYNSIVDHSLPADDPKRWERALPRAMRDVTRSSRYLAEQRERDRTGASVVNFDPNDLSDQMDALGQGLGFKPTQVSRQWDAIEAAREVQMYWKGQRKVLMDSYARAGRLNDVEGKQDVKTAIKEFNKEVPYAPMKITQENLSQSMKARARERKAKETRVPVQKSLQGVSKDVRELFPEAPPPVGLRRRLDQGGNQSAPPSIFDDVEVPQTGPQVIEQKRVR